MFRGECQDRGVCLFHSDWLQTSTAMLTDCQGAGDAAISPDPGEDPWPPRLPVSAARRLQCLLTGLQGLLLPHQGVSLIHRLYPAECEWWWPGTAGLTEQQIEMNWTPWRGERATTIRKMTVTLLQVCAVISEKGRWHPSAAGEENSVYSPPPPRALPLALVLKFWPDIDEYILYTYTVKWNSDNRALTCRFHSASQGGSTSND